MDKPAKELTLISSMTVLFYVTKFFGVIPYALGAFYKRKILKISIAGNVWVALATIISFLSSHYESSSVNSGDTDGSGTLTKMIGISLMYMEPIMLVIDVGGFVLNQKKLVACTTTLQELDDKLRKENIIIDYRGIRRITVSLIVVVTIFESSIMAYNHIQLEDSLWFAPLYVSTISKIWYVGLVYNVKQKFVAINLHLENMQRKFNDNKRKIRASYDKGKLLDSDQIGYLQREIVVKKNKATRKYATRRKADILQVQPRDTWTGELYGSHKFHQTIKDVHTVVGDKLDKKLLVLTQLHFEIAEVSKTVNQMFSFQMLFLMAYGFMAITARIYFVYTGMAGQHTGEIEEESHGCELGDKLYLTLHSIFGYISGTRQATETCDTNFGTENHLNYILDMNIT
ncbi:hypothetical protein HA402_012968 [Bradysia odoriphaga]|nr:hypothetical protein HA402_012968 [Bradysia odoriphaga]